MSKHLETKHNDLTQTRSIRTGLMPVILPVAAAVVCAVLTYIACSFTPKIWRADTTLYFPNGGDTTPSIVSAIPLGKGPSLAEKGGQVSLFGGALVSPQVASGPQTAIAVLASLNCRKQVMSRLSLNTKWAISEAKALKRLELTVVFVVDKNGLLAIECDDTDQEVAKQIVGEYVRTLRELADRLSLNLSSRNRKFLEERLRRTRSKVSDIETKILLMQSNHGRPDPSFGNALDAGKAVIMLQQELIKARVELDAVISQLEWQKRTTSQTLKAGAHLPAHTLIGGDARKRLAGLEFQFAVTRISKGPDHPDYRREQQELEEARRFLDVEIRRASHALAKGVAPELIGILAQKAGLEAQVRGLQSALLQWRSQLSSVPAREFQQDILIQELKSLRVIVEYQEMETERARIAEDRDNTAFQIIDEPYVQSDAVSPRRGFNTLLAALAGLLLSVAWLSFRKNTRVVDAGVSPDGLL